MKKLHFLYTLVYLSTYHSSEIAETELLAILSRCRKNNSERQVTGLLIFAEGTFIQALEGNKEDVLQIYNKVKGDSRHFGVAKILDHHHNKRVFEKWSMGFKTTSLESISHFLKGNNEMENNDLINLIKSERTRVLTFLHSFYENNFENHGVARMS